MKRIILKPQSSGSFGNDSFSKLNNISSSNKKLIHQNEATVFKFYGQKSNFSTQLFPQQQLNSKISKNNTYTNFRHQFYNDYSPFYSFNSRSFATSRIQTKQKENSKSNKDQETLNNKHDSLSPKDDLEAVKTRPIYELISTKTFSNNKPIEIFDHDSYRRFGRIGLAFVNLQMLGAAGFIGWVSLFSMQSMQGNPIVAGCAMLLGAGMAWLGGILAAQRIVVKLDLQNPASPIAAHKFEVQTPGVFGNKSCIVHKHEIQDPPKLIAGRSSKEESQLIWKTKHRTFLLFTSSVKEAEMLADVLGPKE
eukprot:gb/GECH01002864.1/.p1 GENE.gb/GECH01002864.1/~~gb/GECH01002864.1/.p1  ORF type:complete len:307 (+),score=57.13 gb/GECH01002864.1/:1-921(+)